MQNIFRIYIKRTVIGLCRFSFFYRFFVFIYKIQLLLIVFILKQQKEVSAIILRRKGVLVDLYPGDSDYDITCVFAGDDNKIESALFGLAKKHEFLKAVCPVLGETKFIREKDLLNHFAYFFVDYCGDMRSLCFLYKKNNFIQPVCDHYIFAGVYQAIAWILITRIVPEFIFTRNSLISKKLIFSRPVYKIYRKVKWQIGLANTGIFSEFNYNKNDGLKKNCFMYGASARHKILQESADMIVSGASSKNYSPTFSFTIAGETSIPDSLLDYMHYVLRPITANFKEAFAEIVLCNYRLYNYRMLLAKHKGEPPKKTERVLFGAVKQCSYRLKPLRTLLVTECPILLSAPLWDFFMASDPIVKILYEHTHYDFLKERVVRNGNNSATIDKEYLYAEIADALDIIHSAARSKNTANLLNVLFGHLMTYNLLLERGVFYTSFGMLYECHINKLNLNSAQQEIIDIYRQEGYKRLEKINTLKVWHIFKDLILQETNAARILLNGKTSLHQNFKKASIT